MPKLILVPLGEAPKTPAADVGHRAHAPGGHRRGPPPRLGGNPDQPSRPLVKTTALVNLAPQRVMQDGLLRRSGGATSRSTRPVQAGCTS